MSMPLYNMTLITCGYQSIFFWNSKFAVLCWKVIKTEVLWKYFEGKCRMKSTGVTFKLSSCTCGIVMYVGVYMTFFFAWYTWYLLRIVSCAWNCELHMKGVPFRTLNPEHGWRLSKLGRCYITCCFFLC